MTWQFCEKIISKQCFTQLIKVQVEIYLEVLYSKNLFIYEISKLLILSQKSYNLINSTVFTYAKKQATEEFQLFHGSKANVWGRLCINLNECAYVYMWRQIHKLDNTYIYTCMHTEMGRIK